MVTFDIACLLEAVQYLKALHKYSSHPRPPENGPSPLAAGLVTSEFVINAFCRR